MKHFRNTSLELLEQRIAPAGLVTVRFLNGLLTLSGGDGADHEVHIVKTGTNLFRVEGIATDIGVLGQTAKNFHGTLSHVLIEGGSGADTFEVTNLSALTSLRFHGNAGVDSLTTKNLSIAVGGRVEIALGSESGSVDFSGSRTTIHGALNINLGGGGTARFDSASTTVGGNVAIVGGDGGDSVLISGYSTLFRRTFSFSGGAGDDAFTATGNTLRVSGFVTMDGGAGTNHFAFAADRNLFGNSLAPGLMDLKLGVGPGAVIFLGASTNVLGNLKIDLGLGGGIALLNSEVTAVRNSVQVAGGAGNDMLGFEGRTSIGGGLSFLGNAGDDVLTARGGLFSVRGATSMDGGVGASTFDLRVGSIALAALTVNGGTVNDTVSIIADGTIAGNVSLQLGLDGIGPSSTILKSQAGVADGLKFSGALTIAMSGATVDTLTIANIQVAKNFDGQTGENVSTVDISGLNVKGNLKLQTGAGADVVNIDNIKARDFYVDTQVGADGLRIERNAAYTGSSQVLGVATILTGIGADQIRIGNSSDFANTKVFFIGAMTLDAGDGANMRNDILASNYFQSAPIIGTGTSGGTLTQTAAI